MSQIGKCQCGQTLIKKSITTANSNEPIEIELCTKCDSGNFGGFMGLEKSRNFDGNAAQKDRFGLEQLKK